jgi:outer membrane protein
MFKVIKCTVAILALSVSVAKAQQMPDSVLTLQQCIDIGVKNNLLVKQSELQMENQSHLLEPGSREFIAYIKW